MTLIEWVMCLLAFISHQKWPSFICMASDISSGLEYEQLHWAVLLHVSNDFNNLTLLLLRANKTVVVFYFKNSYLKTVTKFKQEKVQEYLCPVACFPQVFDYLSFWIDSGLCLINVPNLNCSNFETAMKSGFFAKIY